MYCSITSPRRSFWSGGRRPTWDMLRNDMTVAAPSGTKRDDDQQRHRRTANHSRDRRAAVTTGHDQARRVSTTMGASLRRAIVVVVRCESSPGWQRWWWSVSLVASRLGGGNALARRPISAPSTRAIRFDRFRRTTASLATARHTTQHTDTQTHTRVQREKHIFAPSRIRVASVLVRPSR